MKIEQAIRVFKYNGMELQDPGAAQPVEEVREFYANLYPELNNAEIEGPEHKAGKIIYEFHKTVGTKGADQLNPRHRPTSPAKVYISKGAALINAERDRQIFEEGWTAKHDDEHDDCSLAIAAICYAAPEPIYVLEKFAQYFRFTDPWPDSWDERWDKRERNGNKLIDSKSQPNPTRIRSLVKAGALIAAEIDRLLRAENRRGEA